MFVIFFKKKYNYFFNKKLRLENYEIINNCEFYEDMSMIEFLKDIGKKNFFKIFY